VHPTHAGIIPDIPWTLIERHERQARENHYQSLDGLARRGGLSLIELYAVLNDRRYDRFVTLETAVDFVRRAISAHNGGRK
jgi:hypothetical protein